MRWIRPIINLILYGHFWIATAALAMAAQTEWLLNKQLQWSPLLGFIASGTLMIYALHRMVALKMQPAAEQSERFAIMHLFRHHILFYALAAGVLAAYFYWHLPNTIKLNLLVPCAIALGYVLPLLNGKRLRDVPYVKIFLIALAWSWITVATPASYDNHPLDLSIALMLVERACFVFAITIPFDIRDLELDRKAAVGTIPAKWGMPGAKKMAYFALILCTIAVLVNFSLGFYSPGNLVALFISVTSTASFVHLSHPDRHDYFFTGLLDGTMTLQALLIILI